MAAQAAAQEAAQMIQAAVAQVATRMCLGFRSLQEEIQ